jgi:hypothetical protein
LRGRPLGVDTFFVGAEIGLRSGCVLRTAWANISRSLSLEMGAGRTYFFGSVIRINYGVIQNFEGRGAGSSYS